VQAAATGDHDPNAELVDDFEAQLARAGVAIPQEKAYGAGAASESEDGEQQSSSESDDSSDSDGSSSEELEQVGASKPSLVTFIPSKRFTGSKPGYYFSRKAKIGLGYHFDTKGAPQQQLQNVKKEKKKEKGKEKKSGSSGSSGSQVGGGLGGSSVASSKGNKRNAAAAAAADVEPRGKKQRGAGRINLGSTGDHADGGAGGMFGRERRFHADSKAAARQRQAEKDAEIEAKLARNKELKATRLEKSRHLSRKNKRGQINMNAQIEHILNKLEKRG